MVATTNPSLLPGAMGRKPKRPKSRAKSVEQKPHQDKVMKTRISRWGWCSGNW